VDLIKRLNPSGKRLPLLKISRNRRYLTSCGKPFFWLADTAWQLVSDLTREEILYYMTTRLDQGYTVIQCMSMYPFQEWVPNAYGDYVFKSADPRKPVEAYFRHLDYAIDLANALGLYICIAATWGEKLQPRRPGNPFTFDRKTARKFGEYLGTRYRSRTNIIWIVVGDEDPRGYEKDWSAMAEGLKKGSRGRHMITAHAAGKGVLRASSEFFNSEKWLDLNMYYSGHSWNVPSHAGTLAAYRNKPVRPVFDGEPRYENHPAFDTGAGFYTGGNRKLWDGVTRFNARQVRQCAWWNLMAGACGHTYGHHDVWQFNGSGNPPRTFALLPWHRAIQSKASVQMGYLRQFMESRKWWLLAPAPDLVVEGQGQGERHIQAALASDGSFLMAYIPNAESIVLDVSGLKGKKLKTAWFNPQTAEWVKGRAAANRGTLRLAMPSVKNVERDWALIVDAGGGGK